MAIRSNWSINVQVIHVLINILSYTQGRPTDTLWNSLSRQLSSGILSYRFWLPGLPILPTLFLQIRETHWASPRFFVFTLQPENSLQEVSWGLAFFFPITQRSLFLIALIICHHLFHLFIYFQQEDKSSPCYPSVATWLQVDVSQLWFLTHSSTHHKQFVLFSVNLISVFAI